MLATNPGSGQRIGVLQCAELRRPQRGSNCIDGPDRDEDGIPDSSDDNDSGFGEINDPGAENSDGQDTPDYIDSDSNNDGINDVIMIFGGQNVVEVQSFLIFNRWGEQVFEATNFQPDDPDFGWDGTFRGELLNPAVFVYYAEVEFTDGEKVMYKGSVTLIE